eukprot:2019549-Pleurochrysis_carterae.AAC.1
MFRMLRPAPSGAAVILMSAGALPSTWNAIIRTRLVRSLRVFRSGGLRGKDGARRQDGRRSDALGH